jgi:hypothetical protein
VISNVGKHVHNWTSLYGKNLFQKHQKTQW